MKVNPETFSQIARPMYIVEERRLRSNLQLISDVAQRADVEIILAYKAFALWKTFPIFREYIGSTTASSLYEARMAFEFFGAPAHTYTPAYTEQNIGRLAQLSSHLTFNSLTQAEHFHSAALAANPNLSLGLRINPEWSEVDTLIYNPCAPGTRFGVTADQLADHLPEYIEGFHCHCHCESSAEEFVRSLEHICQKFEHFFPKLKWINFGGGHLMTRTGYNVSLLVSTLKQFHQRFPHLHVILEPGSAFAWQTGPLVAQVCDVVENQGIRTAILNVSFTCHMPDCLEMPYRPAVRGAQIVDSPQGAHTYRLGGCSCLSGDFMGYWAFPEELFVGDNIIFEDMIHYTTVKTNMFNGVDHPAIGLLRTDNTLEILREFTFDDYISRMD